MNIVMFTNLYFPHVGGIQKSIAAFKEHLAQRGHKVRVVIPLVEREPIEDPDIIQVPALQNFNGSDFSVAVVPPGFLHSMLDDFEPDIVHSHHPFLLGDTAVRIAATRELPLVFTYHTMWEHYLHYAPSDSEAMQTFVKRMAVEYCNLCDQVITPTNSIAEILRERGVTAPIEVIPTGIDAQFFAAGDPAPGRDACDIPAGAFVAGYVGRFGPEKNLPPAAAAVAKLCQQREDVHALFVGKGPAEPAIREAFEQAGVADRLHMPGLLRGEQLVNAYRALDVFVFTSKSETQGLVLAEALTTATPVVAVDAPGSRDVIKDGENGRLLPDDDVDRLADALDELYAEREGRLPQMRDSALRTAAEYAMPRCTDRLEQLYVDLTERQRRAAHEFDLHPWRHALEVLSTEWKLWSKRVAAAADAVTENLGDYEKLFGEKRRK